MNFPKFYSNPYLKYLEKYDITNMIDIYREGNKEKIERERQEVMIQNEKERDREKEREIERE